MSVDHGDARIEIEGILRRLKALETGTPQQHSADAAHLGSGTRSIQLGESATASGQDSTALGSYTTASDDFATALGTFCEATRQNSIAIGIDTNVTGLRSMGIGLNVNVTDNQSVAIGYNAASTAGDQIMLGTAINTVVVPGTFSNPSARRLKQNIIPAPSLTDIFPELVEYEYIDGDGKRRLGYIADDLVGTEAERFVQFTDDGQAAGIDPIGLLIAQVARLNARITELEG